MGGANSERERERERRRKRESGERKRLARSERGVIEIVDLGPGCSQPMAAP